MALLQKMGWKEGEGLGKDKMGELEPLKLDIKIDRRGSYAFKGKGDGSLVGRGLEGGRGAWQR